MKALCGTTSLRVIVIALFCESVKEGAVGIFGFADLTKLWFGFSVLALKKLQVFGLGVLPDLRVSSNSVFSFRFLSTTMAVFRIQVCNAFHGFSGFAKEVGTCSRAKINSKRPVITKHHGQRKMVTHQAEKIWLGRQRTGE